VGRHPAVSHPVSLTPEWGELKCENETRYYGYNKGYNNPPLDFF
jgi:hypothetical protein